MFLLSSLAALAALASQSLAFPLNNLPERDTGLTVKLSAVGNTHVKAVVTNNGAQEMSFLKYNTFFDSGRIRKVQVTKDGSVVPFAGFHFYYDMSNLPKEAFKTLAPGASAETEFDIAETFDLSDGGSYTISAEGLLPVVEGQGTTLTSAVRYTANELTMNVDGKLAAQVQKIPAMSLEKRTRFDQNSCNGQYGQILGRAIQTCVGYATKAAQAASSGSPEKFQEYFKTTSQQARSSVAARFQAIAQECGSSNNGRTTYFCTDVYRQCQSGLIAYTYPQQNHVANCPDYYRLPPVVNQGLGPDHGYVIVHEFTHAPGVYSPNTVDHAYGYEQCRRLNSQQSLGNADNYSLYAAAVSRGA
ncbi:Fungalysin/Thermolysin Extracellular metalloproteinase 5 [Emydomyces testavorans]|uniref:Neutral protease 2 n=1 Tax=Emydomyces testavorans TaxID=2070801 RepID=A0AAF0IHZ9_9EURO|nr:Fungalysin/Thermolysin Extracellular metalloproteinase 5 [Emydomyces testavorans]